MTAKIRLLQVSEQKITQQPPHSPMHFINRCTLEVITAVLNIIATVLGAIHACALH